MNILYSQILLADRHYFLYSLESRLPLTLTCTLARVIHPQRIISAKKNGFEKHHTYNMTYRLKKKNKQTLTEAIDNKDNGLLMTNL